MKNHQVAHHSIGAIHPEPGYSRKSFLRVYGFYQSRLESAIDQELIDADYIFDFSPNMKDRRIGYEDIITYNPYPPVFKDVLTVLM